MPQVTLSVSSGWSAAAGVSSRDIIQSDGANTLRLARIALVVRKLELKRRFQSGCSTVPTSDPTCQTFAVGPLLVELPVDRETAAVVSVDVTPGIYDEVEFEIHKPDDDTPGDREFLTRWPEFRRVSIRVEGEYNGEPFVFTQDLNESQQADLVPALEVLEDAPATNVTLRVDARSWFWRGAALVDPRAALKGGPDEKVVEDNIERSIAAFVDRDWNGQPDN
ncbi:MAG: hypothetical protein R3E10_12675 [Gemmatimonadota bacterium]